MFLAPPQTAIVHSALSLWQPSVICPFGYWIDTDNAEVKAAARTDWQRKLPDAIPVSLVSIPATHDAGAVRAQSGQTHTQSLTIAAQLTVGVRGFDIRLRQEGSTLHVYHSEESQQLSFHEIVDTCRAFLRRHPGEFLVMRVKEETKPLNPQGTFADAFKTETLGLPVFKARSRTQIPTVGEVRGKLVVLDNVGSLPDTIAYDNEAMKIQDDWETPDMDKKTAEILALMEESRADKSGKVWYLNYTSSCCLTVDQIGNAKAVNPRIDAALTGKKGNLGIVWMNFPGLGMIGKVIDSNF